MTGTFAWTEDIGHLLMIDWILSLSAGGHRLEVLPSHEETVTAYADLLGRELIGVGWWFTFPLARVATHAHRMIVHERGLGRLRLDAANSSSRCCTNGSANSDEHDQVDPRPLRRLGQTKPALSLPHPGLSRSEAVAAYRGTCSTQAMTDHLAAFMQEYYYAYNSGDPEQLRPFYAHDIVFDAGGFTMNGAGEMIATYTGILTQFRDEMTPDTILVDGNRAAVEITDVFTAKVDVADWMGQSLAAGESLTMRLCGIYTVGGGRIQHAAIYRA